MDHQWNYFPVPSDTWVSRNSSIQCSRACVESSIKQEKKIKALARCRLGFFQNHVLNISELLRYVPLSTLMST